MKPKAARRLLFGIGIPVVLLLAAGVALGVGLWRWPRYEQEQRRRETFAALEARLLELERRVPSRWEVAPGVRPTTDENIVPSTPAIRALRAAVGRTRKDRRPPIGEPVRTDTTYWWRRYGSPPAPLVRRLMASDEARAAIARLADGSYGAPTGATCVELEEVMMMAAARAYAAPPEECMEAVIDALRVAQAIQPVPRVDCLDEYELAGAGWMLASIEPALIACSRDTDDATRQEGMDALLRLERESTRPASAYQLVLNVRWRIERARREAEEEVAREEFTPERAREHRARFDPELERLGAILDITGPWTQSGRPETEIGADFGYLCRERRRAFGQRRVLLGVMRVHAGMSPNLGDEGDEPLLADEESVQFPNGMMLFGCETPLDGMATYDVSDGWRFSRY